MKNFFSKVGLALCVSQGLFGTIDSTYTFSADAVRPSSFPVRFPRSLLERELSGSFEATLDEGNIHFVAFSPISWIEQPTLLPAPLPGALADFRDFKGCLNYQNLNGVALCFNIMPDVSSIGINSREMQSNGIENFITEQLGEQPETAECAFSVSDVNLTRAVRNKNEVVLYYTANLQPQSPCHLRSQIIQFNLQFSSI